MHGQVSYSPSLIRAYDTEVNYKRQSDEAFQDTTPTMLNFFVLHPLIRMELVLYIADNSHSKKTLKVSDELIEVQSKMHDP